jgi:hypothetical protein
MFHHSKFKTASAVAVLLIIIYILFASSDPSLPPAQFCCIPAALFALSGLLLGAHEGVQ